MNQILLDGTIFSSLFSASDVLCHAAHDGRDTIIRAMTDLLISNHGLDLDPAMVASSLCAHEEAMPTMLAPGIFLPHVRIGGIPRLTVAVATSQAGVPYGPEGNRAHLIILALVPKDDISSYLNALSSLAKVCGQPDIVDRIVKLEIAEEVWKFFDRGGRAN